jgi:hypothetical protein
MTDGRRSRPYKYRVEFHHRDDGMFELPDSRIVNARNQREATRKFRGTPLYRNNRRDMVVDGATREPRKQRSGRWGF